MLMTEYATSGQLYDFNCFDTDGSVWNGSAFVAWADGDYLAYRVPATEAGTSGRFTATAPTGTARWEMRLRGATLAISYVVAADKDLTAAFKADAELGTADGGLVANVGKIPRAATAKADGEAVTRNKVGTATASTLTETLS